MLVNNARELGTRMRDQRLELGLSQAALAKRVGVSRSWVVQVERGNAGAEIGLVLKAFAALGLDLDVRAANAPAAPLDDGGDSWTPNLANILERARGAKP
jgi:transcriptional regulator with XRE-family HTH domain